MASKTVASLEEAEARRLKAVDFLDRIGQSDKADEFRGMDASEYVAHAGLQVVNPHSRRKQFMANGQTKSEIQDVLDQVESILQDAYQPETDRETAIAAIADALDAITGPEEEEEDEDEDLDDDANGD